jgi:hypothetical protein
VLLSEVGAAITILNWTGKPISDLQLKVHLPFTPQQVRSVRGEKLTWRQDKDGLFVSLPLASVDILVFEKGR